MIIPFNWVIYLSSAVDHLLYFNLLIYVPVPSLTCVALALSFVVVVFQCCRSLVVFQLICIYHTGKVIYEYIYLHILYGFELTCLCLYGLGHISRHLLLLSGSLFPFQCRRSLVVSLTSICIIIIIIIIIIVIIIIIISIIIIGAGGGLRCILRIYTYIYIYTYICLLFSFVHTSNCLFPFRCCRSLACLNSLSSFAVLSIIC